MTVSRPIAKGKSPRSVGRGKREIAKIDITNISAPIPIPTNYAIRLIVVSNVEITTYKT